MPAACWSPIIDPLVAPEKARALSDVRPLLAQLIAAYGSNPIVRLLDVDAAVVKCWRSGAKISPEMSRRVLDLHAVLLRALQIFTPQVATQWLIGHEPFLDEARPIDVLGARGAAPLIEALDAIAAGAYA